MIKLSMIVLLITVNTYTVESLNICRQYDGVRVFLVQYANNNSINKDF